MLFPVVLSITALAVDSSPSVRAPAVAAAAELARRERSESFAQGIPWTGEPGITETVDEIMAREASSAKSAETAVVAPVEIKPRLMAPGKVQDDASAPEVSRWPPPGEPRGSDAAPLPEIPQTVGTSFLGPKLSESGFIPPDSMGAVGPSQVLVIANGRIKVFDKNGVLGGLNATTNTFFALVRTGGTSDPHVRYDRLSGRWFVTMIDVATVNRVLIAVSSSSTITSTSSFTFFSFQHDLVGTTPNADTGLFADYDTLGVDKFALYIGVNMFTSADAFRGTTGFVINKANLLVGTLTVTPFRQLGGSSCPGAGLYTPQGVHNDDPQATEGYFIGVDLCTSGTLILRRITNPGGAPSISGNLTLTGLPSTTNPIAQVASGSTHPLDAIDDRLFAASIHTNAITGARTLWTAHNIQVNSSGAASGTGGRNGSRWYEIGSLTTTPALIQSGTLFDSAASNPFGYWFPSVAMSGQGHMAMASSVASAATFAGIAAVGRLRTDALGTIQTPTLAQAGAGSYNVQSTSVQRWGDYSQVVVDPNDNQTMWTFQEYADATNSWGVRAIQLTAPPPATPAVATPATVASGQASVNVTIDGTSLSGSEFFDPGPDTGGPGFLNHITASISGGVTVNAVPFASPTEITLNISTVGATGGAKDVTITNPDGQSRTGVGLLTVTTGPLLTVVKSGTGGGTVTSGPPGINCGSTCSAGYTSGTSVTLTATAASDSVLAGWTGGGCSGTGSCVVTLSSNTTVTAVFALKTSPSFTLTIAIIGSAVGTVTSNPAGINCGATCSASYIKGTPVLLTVTAASGAVFSTWGGACSGTATTCTVTVDAAKSVTATFSQVFTDGTGAGSPIAPQSVVIKAVHVTELRSAIDRLRVVNNLPAFGWTDPTLTVHSTVAKRIHFLDLRTALAPVCTALPGKCTTYTDATISTGHTVIKAVHLNELRANVRALQ